MPQTFALPQLHEQSPEVQPVQAASSMMIVGYAMRAASEGIPGVTKPRPQEPVVILLDKTAGVGWLTQSDLSRNIEDIEEGLKKNPNNPFAIANRNLYREALEGLQERIKEKYDFGKPLQSPRDFIVPREKPALPLPGTRVAQIEELERMYGTDVSAEQHARQLVGVPAFKA